jgi:hypothetical protein
MKKSTYTPWKLRRPELRTDYGGDVSLYTTRQQTYAYPEEQPWIFLLSTLWASSQLCRWRYCLIAYGLWWNATSRLS